MLTRIRQILCKHQWQKIAMVYLTGLTVGEKKTSHIAKCVKCGVIYRMHEIHPFPAQYATRLKAWKLLRKHERVIK